MMFDLFSCSPDKGEQYISVRPWLLAVSSFFTAAAGTSSPTGYFSIPFALKEAGVGLGILLLLLIGWINDFTLIILIEAGDAVGASTYQDLMLHSFGKIGYHIMTLIQAVYPFIAYICHHNSYLLYNSMESRSPHQWVQVTHVTVIVAGAMALFVGVVGYGTFTGFTEGDVMENYCWQDDLMTAARAIFCFTIMLTHPVEVFVVREVLTTAIFPSLSKSEHYYLMHILVSVAIVGIGYAASLITSCLGIVLELNGILAAIPLAYILPCACYLRCAPRAHISHRLFAAVILTCGIVVSLSGIVTMIARGESTADADWSVHPV
ncbi:unnamed protein product [Cyprideis torosa]|uniref:Putative sodium-coupled neutral amino acid transporter 11 n=1 Tax=Cyprideis torosa TaxID=163714 RepID=A0A7R8W3Y3_9CRUS|nr:unnamed protein product [Cyprideis torosa]CAG0879053.1 unnamed protein product [Cyprideis torosa]